MSKYNQKAMDNFLESVGYNDYIANKEDLSIDEQVNNTKNEKIRYESAIKQMEGMIELNTVLIDAEVGDAFKVMIPERTDFVVQKVRKRTKGGHITCDFFEIENLEGNEVQVGKFIQRTTDTVEILKKSNVTLETNMEAYKGLVEKCDEQIKELNEIKEKLEAELKEEENE